MKFLFSCLYNFVLLLIALATLPHYVWKRKNWKRLFFQKWGADFYQLPQNKEPLFWIHAVSVGETKAIATLAKQFHQDFPQARILVTSITETGHAEAKRSIPFAHHHLYLPFDFSWVIKPIMQKLKPDLVLFSETDYWYHFATFAKANGAKIAIVNGKLSERSYRRYQLFRRLPAAFFSPIDHFSLQSEQHALRFSSLGISPHQISVSGNLKMDAAAQLIQDHERQAFYQQLGFSGKEQILVAGSTHPTEEKLILDLFNHLRVEFPNLRLLIAPRHPERFGEIKQLMQSYSFSSKALSEGSHPTEAVLIDSMGLLQSCYQISEVAIVGGSFTPHIGGHNILEPCHYGKPVLFGPYMHNQTDLCELVLEHQAGIQTTSNRLQQEVRALLLDLPKRAEIGSNGLKLIHTMSGASQRVCSLLTEKLQLRDCTKRDERANI